MLVLTREQNESLWIGEHKITVVRVKDGKVRLGVDAAPDVKILRDELRGQAATHDGKALTHEGQAHSCCGSPGRG